MSRMNSFKKMLHVQSLPFEDRITEASALVSSLYQGSGDIHRREFVVDDPCRGTVSNVESGGAPARVVMFGSNDYLGLSQLPEVKQAARHAVERFGTSFSGSPVMNGLSPLHTELERKLAALKNTETSVLLPSGFAANLAWVRALVAEHDFVVADQYGHTSFREALRALPKARRRFFAHNSATDLRRQLSEIRKDHAGTIFVFVEGLYSMHGDVPPLPDILEVCEQHGALPVVDDAHGTGTLGRTGRGVFEHFGIRNVPFIVVGTLSKALGAVGGFVGCKSDVALVIRANASSYIFSASLPPATAAAAIAAVDALANHPERLERLRRNIRHAANRLHALGVPRDWQSPIFPIKVPEKSDVTALVTNIGMGGYFVNGVSFPAVPIEDQRVRISISSEHSTHQIDALADLLTRVMSSDTLEMDVQEMSTAR
jgi:glycine C-acetyltransferase